MNALRRGDAIAIVAGVLAVVVSTLGVFAVGSDDLLSYSDSPGLAQAVSLWSSPVLGLPLFLLVFASLGSLLAAPVPLWLGAGSPANPGAARTFSISLCFVVAGYFFTPVPKTLWFWLLVFLTLLLTFALFATERIPELAKIIWSPTGAENHRNSTLRGTEFSPFWVAVPQEREAFSTQTGDSVLTLSPDQWYLVIEERAEGLLLQTDVGSVLLRDVSFLILGD